MTATSRRTATAAASPSPSEAVVFPRWVWLEWLGVCLLFVLLALWYTNPLWRHPATFLVDNGDPLHNVCISWWLSDRILSGHLAGIWNLPPIFYPAHHALTFSDPQIAVTLLGLPIYALTGSIVAAYNFVVLISIPLCALGAYALARHLTRSRGAALVAGIVWGFGAWHSAQASHRQLLSLEALPFLLLCLHRYGQTQRGRYLVGLFLCWTLQEYLCEYWGMFLILLIGPFALLLLWNTYQLRGRALGKALAAMGLAVVVWLPSQWLFLVEAGHGHQHSEGMVNTFSANLADYFPTPGTWLWDGLGGTGYDQERTVSPGLIALCLGAFAVAGLLRHARRVAPPLSPTGAKIGRLLARIAPLGVLAAVLAWIAMRAMGTHDLVYFGLPYVVVNTGIVSRTLLVSLLLWFNAPLLTWLRTHRLSLREPRHPLLAYAGLALLAVVWSCGYSIWYDTIWICPGIHGLVAWMPGMRSFRVLARMGVFADLGLSMLAAGGVAAILRVIRERGVGGFWRAAGVGALCGLILAENVMRSGTSFSQSSACLPPPRPVDAWLVKQPPGPLVELPMGVSDTALMWYQIRNQKPMMNGYATFARPDYSDDMDLLTHPESPAAIRRLQELGIRYVLLDPSPYLPAILPAPYRLCYQDKTVSVYELPHRMGASVSH